MASSTARLYTSTNRHYIQFCCQLQLSPYPTSEKHLAIFASHLAHTMSVSSISTYIAAIKHCHTANGFKPLPPSHQLPLIIKGIRRTQYQRHSRRPITHSILRRIVKHLNWYFPAPLHDRLMLAAATSLAFHGLLRVSEFTAPSSTTYQPHRTLRWSDISFPSSHSLKILIRTSKTDQAARGQQVLLGCSKSSTCPVLLLQHYTAQCHHKVKQKALFHFQSGHLLTRQSFSDALRQCLIAANVNPNHYSTHSLRIGGATTAAAAGVHPTLIKELGRWRSDCYQRYTRALNSKLSTIARQMATIPKTHSLA